jgi:hypothetical protein
VRSSRCAKFNGVTILKMKLPGSIKKSSEQIILNYSRALPESRGRDSSKGGRFVTLTFYKNNIFKRRTTYRLHINLSCI